MISLYLIINNISAAIARAKPINNPTERMPRAAHTAVKIKYRRLNAVMDPANAKAEKMTRTAENTILPLFEK